jgi:RHS repeat-associated protein
LLDEQFNYVPASSGFIKVPGFDDDIQTLAQQNIPIVKSGYLFVYLSNETRKRDVFFDNLVVQHYTGPLTEENVYYPFGLVAAGISSNAAGRLENKRKWNAGTELNTDFDINLYETNYRSLDPQLGRFWQIDPMADEQENASPFTFGSNNPILRNDPLGLKDTVVNGKTAHIDQNYGNVTVVGTRKKSGSSTAANPYTFMMPGGGAGAIPLPRAGSGAGSVNAGPFIIVTAALQARAALSDFVRRKQENRWHIVCRKVHPTTGRVYIGRCSGFGSSAKEVLDKYDRNHRMNNNGFIQNAEVLDAINGSVFGNIEKSSGVGIPFGVDAGTDIVVTEISGYAAIRGREQQQYAYHKQLGYITANSINPVWKYNPLAPAYFTASNLTFGPLVNYDDLYK